MDSKIEFNELCRLCLARKHVNIHIFEGEGCKEGIFLKISTCLPVNISLEDKLPKRICSNCFGKLNTLYQFYNKSVNSEKQLLEWYNECATENDNETFTDNRDTEMSLDDSEVEVKEEELSFLPEEHNNYNIKLEEVNVQDSSHQVNEMSHEEVENNDIEPPVALKSAQQNLQTYNVICPTSQNHQTIQLMGSVNSEIVPPEETANIDNKLNTIMTTLDNVLENQHKIMKKFSNFQALFETAMRTKNTDNAVATSSDQNKRISPLHPIGCLEDFKILNEKLKDPEIFNEYVDSLSFICGKDTKTKGIDHSYMLVDKFFTRKFFTLCSWAGGAKVPNTKFPFKFYENVIGLFFKLVHLADPRFTLEDCEDFFKSAIRNSVRRNNSSHIRTSRSKKRPKKLSYIARICENEIGGSASVPVTNVDENVESSNEDEEM